MHDVGQCEVSTEPMWQPTDWIKLRCVEWKCKRFKVKSSLYFSDMKSAEDENPPDSEQITSAILRINNVFIKSKKKK